MNKQAKPFRVEVKRARTFEKSPRNMWGSVLKDTTRAYDEELAEATRIAAPPTVPASPPPPPPTLVIVRQDEEAVFQEPSTGKTLAVPASAAEHVRRAFSTFVPNMGSVLWKDVLPVEPTEFVRAPKPAVRTEAEESGRFEEDARPERQPVEYRRAERRRRAEEAAEAAHAMPKEKRKAGRPKSVPAAPPPAASPAPSLTAPATAQVAPPPPPAATPAPRPAPAPSADLFELRPVEIAVASGGKKVLGAPADHPGLAKMKASEIVVRGQIVGHVVEAAPDKYLLVAPPLQKDVTPHRSLAAVSMRLMAAVPYYLRTH